MRRGKMNAETTDPGRSNQCEAQRNHLILLVEDESFVRDVTRQVLVQAGYRVLDSSNPKEALLLADQHGAAIDLLLTDVVMPGMSGTELAQCLRNTKPNLATVFMSGYAESDAMRTLSQARAIHIQKPFTVDTLLSRIAEALRAQRTAVEA